jgi:hypothetical protein
VQLHAALLGDDETLLLKWVQDLKHPGGWVQVGDRLAPIRALAAESQSMRLAVNALNSALGYAKAWRDKRKGKPVAAPPPWNQTVELRGDWRHHIGNLLERLRPRSKHETAGLKVAEVIKAFKEGGNLHPSQDQVVEASEYTARTVRRTKAWKELVKTRPPKIKRVGRGEDLVDAASSERRNGKRSANQSAAARKGVEQDRDDDG